VRSRDTSRTPACKAAEDALARIVAGEAGAREREDFYAHLSGCPRCTRQLSGVLALTREVRGALAATAARLGEAPPLPLPPRTYERPALRIGVRPLTDFVLLLVFGAGLFLLIALAFFSFRAAVRQHDALRTFRAVNAAAVLSHIGDRARTRAPGADLQALAASLRLDAVRILGPDALTDPWGTPYVIAPAGDRLAVRSAGPDRADAGGAGDDITPRSTAPSLGRPRQTPAHPPR